MISSHVIYLEIGHWHSWSFDTFPKVWIGYSGLGSSDSIGCFLQDIDQMFTFLEAIMMALWWTYLYRSHLSLHVQYITNIIVWIAESSREACAQMSSWCSCFYGLHFEATLYCTYRSCFTWICLRNTFISLFTVFILKKYQIFKSHKGTFWLNFVWNMY